MYEKSLELVISEAVQLITDLEKALARERGGGMPISSREYLELRRLSLLWLARNKGVVNV